MAEFDVQDYEEEGFSGDFLDGENFEDNFGGYEEPQGDDYFARSYDTMSDDERGNIFGSKEFEDLLAELEENLNTSRKFLFQKNKRIVDALYFGGIIDDIFARIPGEITKGRDIIAREGQIISDAKANADNIVAEANTYDSNTRADADNYYGTRVNEGENEKAAIIEAARREAERLVSEHQITLDAKEEGKRIIGKAQGDAKDFVNKTNASVAAYKQSVNKWADDTMNAVVKYCMELLMATRKISADNITSIDKEIAEAKAQFSQIKNQIGYIK